MAREVLCVTQLNNRGSSKKNRVKETRKKTYFKLTLGPIFEGHILTTFCQMAFQTPGTNTKSLDQIFLNMTSILIFKGKEEELNCPAHRDFA